MNKKNIKNIEKKNLKTSEAQEVININPQQVDKAIFSILYKQDRVQRIIHPLPMEQHTTGTPLQLSSDECFPLQGPAKPKGYLQPMHAY